jgi:hypothetical protein
VEAEADWDHLRTPETYLGCGRSGHFASPQGTAFDERQAYELPERLRLNHWALAGEWTIAREMSCSITPAAASSTGSTRATRISCCREAREARFPFACSSTARLQARHTCVDVDIDENGELRDGRMYQLVRQHDPVRDRTLQSTFLEPGERRGVRVHVRAASDADCCDRPRAIWEGVVAERMTTLPLEVDGLLAELEDPASAPVRWSGGGTTMGHVHLKVAAIPETIAFYRDLLGFGVMARFGQRAAFLGAGGYHHHVGANTWESANAPPRPPGTAALRRATLVLPDAGERAHPRAARAARPAGGRARR